MSDKEDIEKAIKRVAYDLEKRDALQNEELNALRRLTYDLEKRDKLHNLGVRKDKIIKEKIKERIRYEQRQREFNERGRMNMEEILQRRRQQSVSDLTSSTSSDSTYYDLTSSSSSSDDSIIYNIEELLRDAEELESKHQNVIDRELSEALASLEELDKKDGRKRSKKRSKKRRRSRN
jgi:hypothetical protein